jgi:hypothetical protein
MTWSDGLASPEVLKISVPLHWFCKDRRKLGILEFVTLKAQIYPLYEHLQRMKISIFWDIVARTAVEMNLRMRFMPVICFALA